MKVTARILLVLSLLVLAACGSSLKIKGNFPKPMVDKIPHTLGVYYEPEFANYVYTEKSGDRSSWVIDAGPAQIAMLSKLLPEMFAQVIPLNNIPGPDQASSADLIFSPKVDSFQYATPRETKINVYEIWIKYNMRVYNGQGQLLADWLMSAYGKTPTAFMKNKEDAINEATVMALRDLGASLSLRFAEIPEIKAWLADHQHAALAASENQPAEGEDHVQ